MTEQVEIEEPQRDYRGKLRSLYQTVNTEPSQTIQSDAKRADITEILKEHGLTDIITHLADTDARFLDVSEMGDYADVMREAKRAEFAFLQLPPRVRKLFKDDVANWLDAAHDEDKRKALEQEIRDDIALHAPPAVEPVVTEVPPVHTEGEAG